MVIVRLNGESNVVVGNTTFSVTKESFGNAIPAFYVTDEASAGAAAMLLSKSYPYAYVVSDTPELVLSVREQCTTANGMIDFRNQNKTALEIRDTIIAVGWNMNRMR